MQDVRPKAHQLNVRLGAVNALAIHYRPLKHVRKLGLRSQVVWSHKVHHAPVFQQVVLERIASQHHSSSVQTRQQTSNNINTVDGHLGNWYSNYKSFKQDEGRKLKRKDHLMLFVYKLLKCFMEWGFSNNTWKILFPDIIIDLPTPRFVAAGFKSV